MSLRLALALAAMPGLAIAAPQGDAKKGEALFKSRCSACHMTVADAGAGPAPSLKGIVGRKAGSAPGFAYSPAMKAAGVTWTRDQLDPFLANPGGKVPGTFMPISTPDAGERADLIAYLATLK